MKVAACLLTLVVGAAAHGSLQLLIAYTEYRNQVRPLDCLVVFRARGVSLAAGLEAQLQREFLLPLMTLNGERPLRLARTIGHNAMAFVLLPHARHFPNHQTDFGLRGRHSLPMIFVVAAVPSEWDLLVFFGWCSKLNILNAILVYESDGIDFVFSYTPFPTFRVLDLTMEPFEAYHTDKVADLQGYQFNIIMFIDPPMLFKDGAEAHGLAGLLFRTYVGQHNATYNIDLMAQSGWTEEAREKTVILAPSRKVMPLSINPFMSVVEFANETATSYPLALTKICVIVPVQPELAKSRFLPLLFEIFTPTFLLLTLLVVVCLHALLYFFAQRRRPARRIEFGLFLIHFLNTMLHQTIEVSASLPHVYPWILLWVGLFGFIWSNTVIATLTALLSFCIPDRQIVSVQDFLNSGLRIMLMEYDRYIYFESELLPPELLPRLLATDAMTMVRHRSQLNRTYAYVTTSTKWKYMNFLQQRLWHLRFRIASEELCSPIMPETWSLQYDSPFDESLKIFFMRMQSYGFMGKFLLMSGIKFGVMKKLFVDDYEENIMPLTLEHFHFAFGLFMACVVICLLAFVGELLLQRLMRPGKGLRPPPRQL